MSKDLDPAEAPWPPDSWVAARYPKDEVALCLSGGGYRAMLFHLGALWRLNELGILKDLGRVAGVSGGAITAAWLGASWEKLRFDGAVATNFRQEVAAPLLSLGSRWVDVPCILAGLAQGGNIGHRLEAALDRNLFRGRTLQDLPRDGEGPRIVLVASNLQSGVLWRFSRPYMRDYRVGEVKNPSVPLCAAVAASAAFPPVLSPYRLDLADVAFEPGSGHDLQRAPFTEVALLADGGVYDNLGLEAVKQYRTVLVSDAGGRMTPAARPLGDWGSQLWRVFQLVDNQVRSQRRRDVVFQMMRLGRRGAFWGIWQDHPDQSPSASMPCPTVATERLANTATSLRPLGHKRCRQLINWGYALSDAAIAKHASQLCPGRRPGRFPFPGVGVG